MPAEILETFSPQLDLNTFTLYQVKVLTHFAITGAAASILINMTLERPKLPCAVVSFCLFQWKWFEKTQKHMTTTKLFMKCALL